MAAAYLLRLAAPTRGPAPQEGIHGLHGGRPDAVFHQLEVEVVCLAVVVIELNQYHAMGHVLESGISLQR